MMLWHQQPKLPYLLSLILIMKGKLASWLKYILWLLVLAILFMPTYIAVKIMQDSYNWEDALASSDRLGSTRSAGELTDLSEASSYLYWAVLAEPGATCTYFVDGTAQSDLPSPFNRRISSPRSRSVGVKPDSSDLFGINIDGQTWDWVSTVRKSNDNQRSISCDSNYLLIERPGFSFIQDIALYLGACLYWVVVAFLFYRFIIKPRSNRTSKNSAKKV